MFIFISSLGSINQLKNNSEQKKQNKNLTKTDIRKFEREKYVFYYLHGLWSCIHINVLMWYVVT